MGSRISLVVFGLSTILLANFGSVSTLTIEGDFIGGQQLGPSIGGGNIVDIFRAAADMWELAIRDNFVARRGIQLKCALHFVIWQ